MWSHASPGQGWHIRDPPIAPFSRSRFVRGGEFRVSFRLMGKLLMLVATIAVGVSATGCVHVAPYERGTLAHPTMTTEDISTGLDDHVRAVSEAAEGGGLGGGGGGCGCN